MSIETEKIRAKIEWFNNEVANTDSDMFKDTRQKAFDLQITARYNLDKWVFSIITLSSAIFGVSVSTLLGKDFIVNKSLFYAGLALFSLNVLVGMWKLKNKIEGDINGMAKEQNFLDDLIYGGVDEVRRQITEFKGDDEKCEQIAKRFNENRIAKLKANEICHKENRGKKDYTTDILFYAFLMAVVLIFGSMVPFNQVYLERIREFVYCLCQ